MSGVRKEKEALGTQSFREQGLASQAGNHRWAGQTETPSTEYRGPLHRQAEPAPAQAPIGGGLGGGANAGSSGSPSPPPLWARVRRRGRGGLESGWEWWWLAAGILVASCWERGKGRSELAVTNFLGVTWSSGKQTPPPPPRSRGGGGGGSGTGPVGRACALHARLCRFSLPLVASFGALLGGALADRGCRSGPAWKKGALTHSVLASLRLPCRGWELVCDVCFS